MGGDSKILWNGKELLEVRYNEHTVWRAGNYVVYHYDDGYADTSEEIFFDYPVYQPVHIIF